MLITLAQVLDANAVNSCRELLNKADWQHGSATAGGLAVQVKHNRQVVDTDPVAQQARVVVLQALQALPAFISAALPKKIFPPKFNAYEDGGCYGLHVDNAIMPLLSGSMLRSDLSATLFLSDPDSYDGGELCIDTDYGLQQIKLAAGDLVLYPSTSLHEVKPVTRGQRLCSFFWIESMVRDSQQRELLYDLDQTIQALTALGATAAAEVGRLTGIYHNLVRRWASAS